MTARTVVERSDIQFSPPLKHLFSATWQQGAANILLKERPLSRSTSPEHSGDIWCTEDGKIQLHAEYCS